MITWRGSVTRCPHCRHPVNSATDFTLGHPPRPGDASMCLYCAELAMFQEVMGAMVLVPLPAHLVARAEADPHVMVLREELRRAQRARGDGV